MTPRNATIVSSFWWIAVLILGVQISLESTLRYIVQTHVGPEPVTANAFATPFLVIHVTGAMTSLLLGPLQFVRQIQVRWPTVHRVTGRVYLLGCVIGAPTGLVLAFGTTAGPVAGAGFAFAAIVWPVSTALAVRAALQRRFVEHREWMLRSYAVLAGAITLRLMLPAALMSGYEFYPAYRIIAWLTWITNLALSERVIRRTRVSRQRAAVEAPA